MFLCCLYLLYLPTQNRKIYIDVCIKDEAWLVQTLKDVNLGDLDEDGNNKIELVEFRHYFANLEKEVPEELVDKVFHDIDKDGDGHITTFEYFKWRDGFKAQKLNQYLPAKIKKSTTHLKFQRQGSKPPRKLYNRKGSSDKQQDNDEIEKLKAQIEKLQKENAAKDLMLQS